MKVSTRKYYSETSGYIIAKYFNKPLITFHSPLSKMHLYVMSSKTVMTQTID